MTGKANLEVRPTFVNKGEIAKRLVEQYGSDPDDAPDFVLCLGDDATDEGKLSETPFWGPTDSSGDRFRARSPPSLPQDHVFSVTVGASSKMTLANWHLLEPKDVIETVGHLNQAGA